MSPEARACRRFDAPPARVYDAWLDAKLIGRWMFGPALRDEEVLRIAVDPRVGGSFSFVVRRQGQDLDHAGQYLELDRPRRLAFTWGMRSHSPETARVMVDIAPNGSGCDCAVTHELAPAWAAHAEKISGSWAKMLEALAKTL
jgi:uncharacterized protein YndB with AHSA1/START domain